MAQLTPEVIEQALQEVFNVVGRRQYVGARYVTLFGRKGESTMEWDNDAPYEPLTVVMHEGNSYVSRQYVPTGVQIGNTDYWLPTFNYNAQVEQYRREVALLSERVDSLEGLPEEFESWKAEADELVADAIEEMDARTDARLSENASFDYGYLGFARNNYYGRVDTSDAITSLVWTDDFDSVHIVKDKVNNLTDGTHFLSDSCALARIGDWWYATFGGSYFKSQDLENWIRGENSMVNPFGYIDGFAAGTIAQTKTGEHIFITSILYDNAETTEAFYNQSKYFYIGYCYVTQDEESGELSFGELHTLNVCDNTDHSEVYIDPTLVYNPIDEKYYFAAKNELTKRIEVYSGASLGAMSRILTTDIANVVEACCLVFTGTQVILKCESFAINSTNFQGTFGTTNFGKQMMYHGLVCNMASVADPFTLNFIDTPAPFRHLTLAPMDSVTFAKCIERFGGIRKEQSMLSEKWGAKDSQLIFTPKDDATSPITINNYGGNVAYTFDGNSPTAFTLDVKHAFNNIEPIFIYNRRAQSYAITLGTSFTKSGSTVTLAQGQVLVIFTRGQNTGNFAFLGSI